MTDEEKRAFLRTDPEDPSTWSMWDAIGLQTFGPEYQADYRRLHAQLVEEEKERARALHQDGAAESAGPAR
jgi:hypothetical protein